MLKNLEQTWDLDVFFPGGSKSPEFAAFLQELEQELHTVADLVVRKRSSLQDWVELLTDIQTIGNHLRHASAFVACLNAQNVKDADTQLLAGRIQQL
ncbi:MAG TPA: oligoendopeptidase, partial [Firmicutes bacterium]|nr:oligoendopeptidase [Bacillota bacterium]